MKKTFVYGMVALAVVAIMAISPLSACPDIGIHIEEWDGSVDIGVGNDQGWANIAGSGDNVNVCFNLWDADPGLTSTIDADVENGWLNYTTQSLLVSTGNPCEDPDGLFVTDSFVAGAEASIDAVTYPFNCPMFCCGETTVATGYHLIANADEEMCASASQKMWLYDAVPEENPKTGEMVPGPVFYHETTGTGYAGAAIVGAAGVNDCLGVAGAEVYVFSDCGIIEEPCWWPHNCCQC